MEGSGTIQHTPAAIARSVWDNRSSVFSWVTAKDSLRVLMNRDKVKSTYEKYRSSFLPDGVLGARPWTQKEWDRRFPK